MKTVFALACALALAAVLAPAHAAEAPAAAPSYPEDSVEELNDLDFEHMSEKSDAVIAAIAEAGIPTSEEEYSPLFDALLGLIDPAANGTEDADYLKEVDDENWRIVVATVDGTVLMDTDAGDANTYSNMAAGEVAKDIAPGIIDSVLASEQNFLSRKVTIGQDNYTTFVQEFHSLITSFPAEEPVGIVGVFHTIVFVPTEMENTMTEEEMEDMGAAAPEEMGVEETTTEEAAPEDTEEGETAPEETTETATEETAPVEDTVSDEATPEEAAPADPVAGLQDAADAIGRGAAEP